MGIKSFFKNMGKNVAYYPGCLTSFVLSEEAGNYRKILEKMQIDFIMLPEIKCCGSPALNAGYEKDARKLARSNLDIIRKYNVRKIITNCPACFKTLAQDYKELLPDWDIEVEHIIITLVKYLRKKKISLEIKEKVAYHDPCHLGRHAGIYQEPREVLERLGLKVVEMKNSKQDSFCCGGGAGLRVNNPKLASDIAKKRIKQAQDAGVTKIITPCPLCYAHLYENSGIEVLEFSHIVAQKLGIESKKTDLKKEAKELGEACS
jgi:heterodisulfide reductase subunit D